MGIAPQARPCSIKDHLIRELVKAHAALVELGDRDVQYILAGDFEASKRLSDEMRQARERSARASQAVRDHMFEHGC